MSVFTKKIFQHIKLARPKSLINLLIFCNLLVYILIPSTILSNYNNQKSTINAESREATKILNECIKIPGSKEQCYAAQFYKLTLSNPIEYSINVLKELQKIDIQARGCHLISHSISSAETEKNPEKWQDVISKVSTNICTGGFIHGVLEVVTSHNPDLIIDQNSIPELCKIIQEKSGDTGEFNCIHIFGHILLADKQGSIPEASKICSLLSEKLRYECYSGVYMENMTRDNLVSHGISAKIPWNAQTTSVQQKLCQDASQKGVGYIVEANSCWRELAHMFAFTEKSNPIEVYKLCQQAPTTASKEDCYFHGLGIMTASHQFDESFISDLCKPYFGNSEQTKKCTGWVMGSLLNSSIEYIDRINKLCHSIPEADTAECFRGVGTRLQYLLKDQSERDAICMRIPEQYKAVCRQPF